jgi:hypothetical protein
MHLCSEIAQTVNIPAADFQLTLQAGETIWTESSHKFTAEVQRLPRQRASFAWSRGRSGVAIRREPALPWVPRESDGGVSGDVSYRIGAKQILSHLNSKEAGETLVLLGRHSGKTTALKMVNGLVQPTEGQVLVEGKADHRRDIWWLRRLHRLCDSGCRIVSALHGGAECRAGAAPEGWEPQRIERRTSELLGMLICHPSSMCSATRESFRRAAAASRSGTRVGGRSASVVVR